MTIRGSENLSMLVDGECDAGDFARLAQEVGQSSEQQVVWRDYHVIGDALRKSLPDSVRSDLAARVALSLASEPAYLLPVSSPSPLSTPTTIPLDDVQSPVHHHKPTRFRAGAVVGFAMAASLSAVAVFNLGQMDSQMDDPVGHGASQYAVPHVAALPVTVASKADVFAAVESPARQSSPHQLAQLAMAQVSMAPVAMNSSDAGIDDSRSMSYPTEPADLYDYLVNYGRYSAGSGQDNMIAHVSLATYNTAR